MELRAFLPLVVALLVAFVLLRLVLGAIKASAKMLVWGIVAVALFGLGYVWYQNQAGTNPNLPSLSIPTEQYRSPQ